MSKRGIMLAVAGVMFIIVSSMLPAKAEGGYGPQLIKGFANVIYCEAVTGGGTQVYVYKRPESVKYEDQIGYLFLDPIHKEDDRVFLEILKEAFGEGKDGYVSIYGLGDLDGYGKIIIDRVWTITIKRTSEVEVYQDLDEEEAKLEQIRNFTIQDSPSTIKFKKQLKK